MDNRNLIIAIVLSVLVLIGWQYFVAGPQIEKAQQQAALQAQNNPAPAATTAPGTAATPGTTPPATPAATLTRDQAIAAAPRVPIVSDRLSGSINLTGGRIDDLHLTAFTEQIDPASPPVTLLSPSEGPDGYFVEFGWLAPAGSTLALPDAQTRWTAPADAKLTTATPVVLTYDNGAGLAFTRTIAVDANYMFTVTDAVANKTAGDLQLFPYARVVRDGEPKTAGTWILHEGPIGVFGGDEQEIDYSSLKEKPPVVNKASDGWLGFTDKYWAAVLIPEKGKSFEASFARFETPSLRYQADFREDALAVPAGGSATTATHLFAGAKQVALLAAYRDALSIDRFDNLIYWGKLWFITKPMFYLIDWFFRLFGNFGLAILAVTVLVKALFFPLANKSYKSMSAMKKVQPQMAEIRTRFKDDKVKQQQALMELYKKEKINPLAGCWPVLVQIPVFFSLYSVLYITIEMRHAPFFWWVKDLSAPDPTHILNLFGLIPWTPPAFLAIGIWPLIMGITMFVQMRLNPTPPDPTQRIIFTWMPLIFTFMLSSFPVGLVIYWAWNNTLSVTQQYVIMRRQGVEVNLWGNIRETFGRGKKADPSKAVTAPVAANDAGAPESRPRQQNNKQKRGPKAKKATSEAKG